MASDYESITKNNVERLGTDTSSRRSQVSMYSDFTHFIYEILQNADDYHATIITFKLFPEKLVIEYDAQKPFTTPNVEAISYFGKSTSRGDLTKAGRFGLGFKSVFALTATPEIHSGLEHFQIFDLYRLRAIPAPSDLNQAFTRIILPFNHDELRPDYVEKLVSKTEVFKRIAERLKQLDMITLLFTLNIREIKWEIGREQGHYIREDDNIGSNSELFKWRNTTITDGNVLNSYRVFSRSILWRDNESEEVQHHRPIDIAFKMDDGGNIMPVKHPLVVLFQTKIETHLGFIINGLYRTPPHRETVSEGDNYNQHLVNETAKLLANTLAQIKKIGLLTINVLNTLPIRAKEEYPQDWMFRPIANTTREELMQRALLPKYDRGFVSAENAKLARGADLRKLINPTQLQTLCNSERTTEWLSADITETQPPDLWKYLTQELKIEVIDPESFARKISLPFLEQQEDNWISEFYGYLIAQESLWRVGRYTGDSGLLRNKEIIRLKDNKHLRPFQSNGQPNAFLPPTGALNYPEIKSSIAQNERALEFLEKLGIRKVGEREQVESLLKTYYIKDSPDPSAEEHIKHMRMFIAWFHKIGDKTLFSGHYLFLDIGGEDYYTADGCFLDLPFKDTGLRWLFTIPKPATPAEEALLKMAGVQPDKVALWRKYSSLEGFQDFAVSMGVMDALEITRRSTLPRPDATNLRQDYYYSGTRLTNTQIDDDFYIERLEDYLDRKSINISKLIWDTIRNVDPSVLTAKFRPNQQYSIRTAPSTLVLSLQERSWIPNKDQEFCSPDMLSVNSLHKDFVFDNRNGWLDKIGFGASIAKATEEDEDKQTHAHALGIDNLESIDIIKEIDKNPDLLTKIRLVIDSEKSKIAFPVHPSQNPERRVEKTTKDIQGANDKTFGQRERSVRVSMPPKQDKETFLRESYTNDDGKMVCQICKREMPFKKRDNRYYFEAVELLSDQDIEHEALYLALCPLCAAMYKEFVKRDTNSMEILKKSINTAETPEVPVSLGQLHTTIRFVENHFLDLQTIIENKETR